MLIDSYIGRNVEIVYRDSRGVTTTRRVAVYSVRNGKVRVLDWDRRTFGTLAAGRILSAVPHSLSCCATPPRMATDDRSHSSDRAASLSLATDHLSSTDTDEMSCPAETNTDGMQPLYSFTVHHLHRLLRS